MRVRIDAERPDPRKLEPALESLRRGEVVIYPTDTGYAFGAAMSSRRGVATCRKLKQIDAKHWKPLTVLVDSINEFGRYGALDTAAFRVVRRLLPGPYTIVMRATDDVPKLLRNRKHEIGLRWPKHAVCELLVRGLGEPLLTGSVRPLEDEPELMDIEDYMPLYEREVSCFVDTGPLWPEPSTVLRFADGEMEVLRVGQGEVPS